MNRRPYFGLTVLLVAIFGVVSWQVLSTREPVYQGTPLSLWLQNYGSLSEESSQLNEALRKMRPSAVPFLLQRLEAHDPPDWVISLKDFARRHGIPRMEHVPAQNRRLEAVLGFRALGADAKDVVPQLVKIYLHSPDCRPWGAADALAVLGRTAEPAIPVFLGNLASTNAEVREIAFGALVTLDRAGRQTIPVLLAHLASTNADVRGFAVKALGEIHSEAERVVPLLVKSVDDPAISVRYGALTALGRFGAEAGAAVPRLVETLQGSSPPSIRIDVMTALAQIRVEPELVVPALVECLQNPEPAIRSHAAKALAAFGDEARPAVPVMLRLLREQPDTCEAAVWQAIAAIDPQSAAEAARE